MTHLVNDTIHGSNLRANELWASIKDFKRRVSKVMIVLKILECPN